MPWVQLKIGSLKDPLRWNQWNGGWSCWPTAFRFWNSHRRRVFEWIEQITCGKMTTWETCWAWLINRVPKHRPSYKLKHGLCAVCDIYAPLDWNLWSTTCWTYGNIVNANGIKIKTSSTYNSNQQIAAHNATTSQTYHTSITKASTTHCQHIANTSPTYHLRIAKTLARHH